MEYKVIKKVSLAIFKDKRLLVVRSKGQQVFYCLGGTVEDGENDVSCLIREVKEEIDCEVREESVHFLAEFEDWAYGKENTKVNIRLYQGQLIGEPKPSSEVEEIDYFDSATDQKYLSKIAIDQMFPWLKEKGYIN